MTSIQNMTAAQAYTTRIDDLQKSIASLQLLAANFAIDAKNAHWGHIGTISHAVERAMSLQLILEGDAK